MTLSILFFLYDWLVNFDSWSYYFCNDSVVVWLMNTSSSNNKTNHDMWGNSYIYKKKYLQERGC